MKKTFVSIAVSLLFGSILLPGCKKETEGIVASEESAARNGICGDCHCRLTKLWFSDVAYVGLHYNNRGLADQWVTHYDDENIETYNIQYNGGRMKKAIYDFNSELQYTIYFIFKSEYIYTAYK